MKSNHNVCEAAFDDGQQRRSAHPIATGRHKLEEFAQGFAKCLSELQIITAVKYKRQTPTSLWLCTTRDMAQWLKQRPEDLAFALGNDVLPLVEGLGREGHNPELVKRLASQARKSAVNLLADCERVRLLLRKDINKEYTAMRCGGSYIAPLFEEALRIVQAVLSETTPPLTHQTAHGLMRITLI
jgi:hypothetical protein